MRKLALLLIGILLAATSTPVQAATAAGIPADSPALIAGAFVPGGTLRAVYPKHIPGISTTFSWFAGADPITGQTSETLLLNEAQVGKVISARVTLTKAGSANTVINLNGLTVASGSMPTSNGSMTYFGETITSPGCVSPHASSQVEAPTVDWPIWMACDPFNNSFGGPSISEYSWYRNGTLVSSSASNTYRLASSDVGQSIWGVYKGTWSNGFVFTEIKRLNEPIPGVLKTTIPTITGAIKAGSKLTAKTTGWDSSATLTYQWFKDYFPISGATKSTYQLTQADLGKAIQVVVSGQKTGFTPASAVSGIVGVRQSSPNAALAYSKVNQEVFTSGSSFDIGYLSSSAVTADSLTREKSLVTRAANFWSAEYTPTQVTVVYLTKSDATWAENLVSQNPGWSSHIPGGITWWINTYNCGFALAFKVESKQVFIQCVRNGSESTLADRQVGPHEYTHWVQYAQTPNLFLSSVPWLIEGQANFYGLALGVASVEASLKTVNVSLAQQATQFDIYNGYKFADFKILSLLKAGNTNTNSILLRRSGTVWDQYFIGSLISEWLVKNFGNAAYTAWMKALLRNQGANSTEQVANNAVAFRDAFGFDYDKLALYAAPYLAARSDELKAAWGKRGAAATTLGQTHEFSRY